MKEEYVNSFLAPAKLVWEKELGCSLELGGMDLAGLVGSQERRPIYGQIQRGQRGMYMIYDGHLKYFYSAGDQKEFLLDHRGGPRRDPQLRLQSVLRRRGESDALRVDQVPEIRRLHGAPGRRRLEGVSSRRRAEERGRRADHSGCGLVRAEL